MASRSHVQLVSAREGRRTLGDDRRDALLRRIRDIVLVEGFASLTVDELAARLQCSKSTLYAVSSTKESLVTAAIAAFLREVSLGIEAEVADIGDPVERLTTYLTAIGREMQRMSQACFDDLGANDSTREIYIAHSAAIRDRLCAFIDEGVASGCFRDVDGRFVADAVSLLVDGIQWGRLLEGTELSPAAAYAAMTEIVLAALTNRGALDAPS